MDEDQEWDDLELDDDDDVQNEDSNSNSDEGGNQENSNDNQSNSNSNTDDDDLDDDDDSSSSDDNTEGNSEEGADPEMSGIEDFLAQFDIEGGMIQYEDGEKTHFNDLDSKQQSKVLNDLMISQQNQVEKEYGLSDSEINIVNLGRQRKGGVEEIINEMAMQRVESLLSDRDTLNKNYDEMSEDSIMLTTLKAKNPDQELAKIEEKLGELKKTPHYKEQAEFYRERLKDSQVKEQEKAKALEIAKEREVVESQRSQVVDAVFSMRDVSGIPLNDGIKNQVLERVLELDESGNSLFMSEAFSDPVKLFNAAYWYYNGPDIIKSMEAQHKKERSASYKRGRSEALGTGRKVNHKSFTDKNNNSGLVDDDVESWEDFD